MIQSEVATAWHIYTYQNFTIAVCIVDIRTSRSKDKCLKGICAVPFNFREAITALVSDDIPDIERMTARSISSLGCRPPRCIIIHLHEDGEDGSVEEWTRKHAAALRQAPVLVVLGAREDGGWHACTDCAHQLSGQLWLLTLIALKLVCRDDRDWLRRLGAVSLKLGAGDVSLLSSQCVVLMHHYLDKIRHGMR